VCDICEKHSKNSVKWYLDAENYNDDLVWKDKARYKVTIDVTGYNLEYYIFSTTKKAKFVHKLPEPFKSILIAIANRKAYNLHAGQVVPLEDALKIVDLAHNHIVIPCYCRRLLGGKEELSCLNFGVVRDLWPKYKPDDQVLELTRNETKKMLHEWGQKGYIHAVFWTKTPYVMAICNCEKKYCTAMKNRLLFNIRNSFKKSHYVARVNEELCDGCGGKPKCMPRCQFNAIKYTAKKNVVTIDVEKCFGCGLCREACDRNAITLVNREEIEIKTMW